MELNSELWCRRNSKALREGSTRNLATIIMCRIVDYGKRFLDFEQVKKVRGESHTPSLLLAEMMWVDCFGVGVGIHYQQSTKK